MSDAERKRRTSSAAPSLKASASGSQRRSFPRGISEADESGAQRQSFARGISEDGFPRQSSALRKRLAKARMSRQESQKQSETQAQSENEVQADPKPPPAKSPSPFGRQVPGPPRAPPLRSSRPASARRENALRSVRAAANDLRARDASGLPSASIAAETSRRYEQLDRIGKGFSRMTTDVQMETDLRRNFEATANLASELDDLFAEMGRQVVQLRAGHRSCLAVLTGLPRTVEVKIPLQTENDAVAELAVQIECDPDPEHHPQVESDSAEALMSLPRFDIGVAQTHKPGAFGGPFVAQSLDLSSHRLRIDVDSTSLFLTFATNDGPAHVVLFVRILNGQGGAAALSPRNATSHLPVEFDAASSSSDDDDETRGMAVTGALSGSRVGRQLEAKLQMKRYLLSVKRDKEAEMASHPTGVPLPRAQQHQQAAAESHAYFLGAIPGGIAAGTVDPDEVLRRALMAWLGPCNRFFTKFKRAKGSWVRSLSAECPKRLTRALRKLTQDRHVLQTVAVVGAFSFFWKRQRELHLARCRQSMRQLAWYKCLLVASRLRCAMSFISRDKEELRRHKNQRLHDDDAHGLRRHGSVLERGRSLLDKFEQHSATTQAASEHLGHQTNAEQIAAGEQLSDAALDMLRRRLGFIARPAAEISPLLACQRHGPGRGVTVTHDVRKALAREMHGPLGREVHVEAGPLTRAPSDDFEDDDGTAASPELRAAMREVSADAMIVTVRSTELPAMEAVSGSPKRTVRDSQFRRQHRAASRKAAKTLLARRAAEAERENGEQGTQLRIIKRYNLQYFDEQIPELPWLAPMQSILLVIRGKAAFHSPAEHFHFQTQLRGFNEARKSAMKRPGVFAPLEAALWSHPVVVALAGKLQKELVAGSSDSAVAFKASLFTGSPKACLDSADRDIGGFSLSSAAQPDGGLHMLRRIAELGGHFMAGTSIEKQPRPIVDWKSNVVATKSPGGAPLRDFGDDVAVMASAQGNIIRHQERALELSHDTEPRELRIERLRLRRRDRNRSGEPREKELIRHSDLKAQKRYEQWMLRTDISATSNKAKAEMQPYFESLIELPTLATGALDDAPRPPAPRAKRTPRPPPPTSKMTAAAGGGSPTAAASSTSSTPPRGAAAMGPVLTAADVGRLASQCDALGTILGLNQDTRCPSGWKSGYRDEPMSEEEIRSARIVEKCLAPSHRIMRQGCGHGHGHGA